MVQVLTAKNKIKTNAWTQFLSKQHPAKNQRPSFGLPLRIKVSSYLITPADSGQVLRCAVKIGKPERFVINARFHQISLNDIQRMHIEAFDDEDG
jgi:hypothetical protein